jgi:SAM-dependent MidA family methyltransferase
MQRSFRNLEEIERTKGEWVAVGVQPPFETTLTHLCATVEGKLTEPMRLALVELGAACDFVPATNLTRISKPLPRLARYYSVEMALALGCMAVSMGFLVHFKTL